MGDDFLDFKVGDFVTRISYNHDIVFKVIDIQMGNCIQNLLHTWRTYK